ncbi:hypothetical protein HY632_04030 [Candidatus Uhrbacteria bacterium]|nr:hypothetical protein [Candidatus Uhrbacteria bacterium]
MRHRHATTKVKLEHAMIRGLRPFLEQMGAWEEIDAITPGRIAKTRGAQEALELRVQYKTPSGLKCKAHAGQAVQEVFIVTTQPDVVAERLAKRHPHRTS